MALAHYKNNNGIGVISIDNPPVNALSIGVPGEIVKHIEQAQHCDSVVALIITGAGRGFIAGADIHRLGKPWPEGEPSLRDVIAACEASSKPVVAAVHGNALGGGLELAMGCHYRVSTAAARFGQPEVKLGFPPGAGGTQRLPRLVGFERALNMIVAGDSIRAQQALEYGLLDQVVSGDLVDGACEFARLQVESQETHTRVRDLDASGLDAGVVEALEQRIAHRARGQRAPYACIECVKVAAELPFDQGLKREREIFEECVAAVESQALRHVFFAERNIAKVPGLSKDKAVNEIRTAGVVGAGTMGAGIAMCFANAGIPVSLLEREQALLDRGVATIEKNYAATVSKGRLSAEDMRVRMALITPVLQAQELASADIVIEAVFEEMPIKLEVFEQLNRACKPDAILASNTSYLDVNAIADSVGRKGKVLGTHFFSPANVMRLLEVVRTDSCSDETLGAVLALAKRLRKVGVVSGVCHGFIGNRMLEGYFREAAFLVEEGAAPQQVDKVMTNFGLAMGPFAVSDLAGLDIGWRKRKSQESNRDRSMRYSVLADRLCELGRFGQKTGSGYYRYEQGSRVPIPDPAVDALILAAAEESGVQRRSVGDQEILERCLYPLINEGANILDEGIALRSGDIDIVWINGYAFPAWRGGPMFHADTVGVKQVYEAVCRYHQQHGAWWEPAPLLGRMAEQGQRFADF